MNKKQKYELLAGNKNLILFRNGKEFLKIPMSVSLNGECSLMNIKSINQNIIEYECENETMTAELLEDSIIVSYRKKFINTTYVNQVKAFYGENGIKLNGFDRAFCPQPRYNDGKNMDYFSRLPDISANGYFSPPVLEFTIGSKDGWVMFGLLDIPDTKICKMDDDYSFLVESCGGNKVIEAGKEYVMPRIIIMFPDNEWSAITDFREKLCELGEYTPSKPDFSQLPLWWKNPFICTYGDQMLEHRVGQKIDEEWIENHIRIAEEEWGIKEFNLVIDDSWQLPHSMEPIEDKERFPQFREMIDGLHKKGHHVILWLTPLFDKLSNGFVTRAQKLNVISECLLEGEYFKDFPGCYMIDYTADNARLFIREVVEILFGDGENQYNADGVKMDFLGLLRDPALTKSYAHPEKGLGIKELYLFYKMFYEEAKKVKPDVIIDSTVGDPRFEKFIDLNRMHDTHCGNTEKEMRVKIATLACLKLPVDSDGALMFNSWYKVHYTSAAIYGIPFNYYLKHYHDFYDRSDSEFLWPVSGVKREMTEAEKKHLGNLFKMTKYKPDGIPVMKDFGEWIIEDNGIVNAACQKGETVVYYPNDKSEKGYIFTWQDEVIVIPLYGRKFSGLTPPAKNDFLLVDYARDVAYMYLEPGEIYTFENNDDKSSVDFVLSSGNAKGSTGEVNYVNA